MTKLAKHELCPWKCEPDNESCKAYSETVIDGFILGKCFACGRIRKFQNTDGKLSDRDISFDLIEELSSIPISLCNIELNLLEKYKVGYVPNYWGKTKEGKTFKRFDQIYLPCYLDQEFRGFQLKSIVSTDYPKYLTMANDTLIYFTELETKHVDTLVITEDWLSAINVSPTYPALALTTCNLYKQSDIFKFIRDINPKKIIVWLDDDKAGINGGEQVVTLLSNFYNTVWIRKRQEPKNCTQEQISDVINMVDY